MNAIYLDAINIPFKNEEFNCIYASHILEHIIEDRKAMSEMYRVLKKNGTLIALIPQTFSLEKTYEDSSIVSPEDRKRVFGQWDHVRLYGCDFSERLKTSGFYVTIFYSNEQEENVNKMKFDEKHIINSDDMENFGLSKADLLYVCSKKID
jgi:ubiquinone/menaquinone biosynthesis C-methylase UbiE